MCYILGSFLLATERRVIMANRKDSKGRVLKTGESQRKDGTYMYRYTDIRGARKSIYAGDLKILREKELSVQKDISDNIDYDAGKLPAIFYVKKYLETKNNLKETTEIHYQTMLRMLDKYEVFHKAVNTIKVSDAKQFAHQMLSEGKKSKTVQSYLSLVSSAFDQVCEDDIIRKNPFKIKPSDYKKKDKKPRFALTSEQQQSFLDFVATNGSCRIHYDDYVILLGTGLRISEYIGLTVNDIDLVKRLIHVNHQVVFVKDKGFKITSLKTENGDRYIYIDDNIYESIVRKIHSCKRYNKGVIIDGYSGFINLSKDGRDIIRRGTINAALIRDVQKYNELYPNSKLPCLTPHTLRHTFCTNMANLGLDVKSLQYLMGHSDVRMTLEVYTHANTQRATSEMKRISETKDICLA